MVDPPEVVVVKVLVVSSLVTGSWTSFFLMQLVPFQLLPDGHERHDPLYMKNPSAHFTLVWVSDPLSDPPLLLASLVEPADSELVEED
jgi:hypothetical protein